MKRHASIGWVTAMSIVGCAPFVEPSPYAVKHDVLGEWHYRVIRLDQRDGRWLDATTSDSVTVEARIGESFLTFEDPEDAHVVQRFRIEEHLSVDGTGARVPDERTWDQRTAMALDWTEGLVPPVLLMDRMQTVESTPWLEGIDGIRSELPTRDATGEAFRWSFPGLYRVRTCAGPDAECVALVIVRHEFTR
jgi:hypothetical protein